MSEIPPTNDERTEARILSFHGRRPHERTEPLDEASTSSDDTNPLFEAGNPDDAESPSTLTNVVAFMTVGAITAAAIWLAFSLADVRKKQDCALLGIWNCASTALP